MAENNPASVIRDELLEPLLRRWIFPMVRVGREFQLPYGGAARRSLIESGAYEPAFAPFLEAVLAGLAGPEYAPGSYYPGGWYRALCARGDDPARARMIPEALAPFHRAELRVDSRGRWWSGEKAISGRVLRFFLANLKYEPKLGLYCVRYPLEQVEEAQYVHAESPPYRVRRVERGTAPLGLELNDGSLESLRPETLWLDGQERLYCSVKFAQVPGGLIAAVDDPARWDLLGTLEEEAGQWYVAAGGERRVIPVRE